MILGTGTDIIEVERIASSFEKFGERFLNRILLPDEIAYCLSHRAPAPFFAVRFSAKEAVSKAFGTGIGAALGWQVQSIEPAAFALLAWLRMTGQPGNLPETTGARRADAALQRS